MNGTKYGRTSLERLNEVDERLRRVFMEVGKIWDLRVVCGYRDQATQERMFRDGKSRARWLESPHNYRPAYAVDVWPYPIVWLDEDRARVMAGYILGVGRALGVDIVWGGDWYGELYDVPSDQRRLHTFDDLLHFELAGWRELCRG